MERSELNSKLLLGLSIQRTARTVVGALLILLGAVTPTLAAISDNVNVDGIGGVPYPAELSLVIWDQQREASYTLDLGIRVDEFKLQAQADTGIQKFWTLDAATDSAFAKLRGLGTASSSLLWAIVGIDAEGFADPGDFNAFLTLQQGPGNGVLNPNYAALRAISNDVFNFATGLVQNNLIKPLNGDSAINPDNTHGTDPTAQGNGRSFTAKGQAGYFGVDGALLNTFGPSADTPIMNNVGQSSWFYHLFSSSYESFDPIAVDEFDNLYADGYWGLAENPNDGSFVLSYTLTSIGTSAEQRRFAEAIGRSETNGGFLTSALAGVAESSLADGRSAGLGLATPVPEPASVALLIGGLLLVAAAVARGRRG